MADAAVSNTAEGNLVWVRIPSSAPAIGRFAAAGRFAPDMEEPLAAPMVPLWRGARDSGEEPLSAGAPPDRLTRIRSRRVHVGRETPRG
jgi:hypothetical protein